jgi:hypothetical protein
MNIKEADIVRMTGEAGGFDATPAFLKRFAELVAAHTLMNIDPSKFIGGYQEGFEAGVAKESEECVQNVLQQHEGFGTEHQGVEYVKQRIVEAIRARSKA